MKAIPNYPYCFVCGDKNERGLNVRFYSHKGKAKAEYTPTREFEGYRDILHGGIISALLDEVMIQAIIAQGILTFTTQIEVNFKKPARIGEKLLLEGEVTGDRGKIIMTRGEAAKEDGTIIATSSGKFFKATEEMKKLLEQRGSGPQSRQRWE
jgi:uncharacterized protein (TIGR00369 family)